MSDPIEEDRLTSLSVGTERKTASRSYTKFIRSMRLVLPVLALAIVAVLFVAPEFEDTIEPLAKEEILPNSASAQNELINPRYESVDKDLQPFTITADKAVQDQNNPELVLLSDPTADMSLKDGTWVAVKSEEGIYEQNTEKLLLKGDVKLFHDSGYQLETEELRVNMKVQEAFSDQDVTAQGPEGTINAIGLEANGNDNTLFFKGPAIMVLNVNDSPLNLGRAIP